MALETTESNGGEVEAEMASGGRRWWCSCGFRARARARGGAGERGGSVVGSGGDEVVVVES